MKIIIIIIDLELLICIWLNIISYLIFQYTIQFINLYILDKNDSKLHNIS